MKRSVAVIIAFTVLVSLLLMPLSSISALATVTNGNFETGDFTGWTHVDLGSGSWFVYTGSTSPFSGQSVIPPPEGDFAAITDQGGPGSHILFQDLTLDPMFAHTLSFLVYYENRAGVFHTPPSLFPFGGPNQQYRVDVMDPSAPVDSVAAGDVLLTLFQTQPGDPFSLPPTLIIADLTAFGGRTVRLRFAEVDNQFFFQASVDDVQLESIPQLIPFDAFDAEVEIEEDEFEVEGSFTLGAASDGIDPLSEDVTVKVGNFVITIPAGSFTLDDEDEFEFEGVIDGVELEVEIELDGDSTFEFEVEVEGVDLTGLVNPVEVTLTIGDDAGTVSVIAEFDDPEEDDEA